MKRCCVFLGLLLFALVSQGQASTEGSALRFTLRVHDVTAGEIPLGAYSLFELIIENSGSEDVRLATGSSSAWMARSPFWGLHIDGPLVSECWDKYLPTPDQPGIGEVPSISIPAKSTRQFPICLAGVGEPGPYRIWVKYHGTRVPHATCYREDIRSEECAFEISKPQGVDADIIRLWKSQNPSKSLCFFPVSMKRNIIEPDILLSRYPTSSYAGWVIRRMSPGARMRHWTVEEMFEDLHRPFRERTGRKGQSGHDAEGNFIWITPEEEAKKYIGLAEPFLSKHEDHILTPVISRRLALAHFVLHQWQEGYEAMKRSLATPWPTSCFSKSTWCLATEDGKEPHREMASEILDFLKQKGLVKDKEEKMEQR